MSTHWHVQQLAKTAPKNTLILITNASVSKPVFQREGHPLTCVFVLQTQHSMLRIFAHATQDSSLFKHPHWFARDSVLRLQCQQATNASANLDINKFPLFHWFAARFAHQTQQPQQPTANATADWDWLLRTITTNTKLAKPPVQHQIINIFIYKWEVQPESTLADAQSDITRSIIFQLLARLLANNTQNLIPTAFANARTI